MSNNNDSFQLGLTLMILGGGILWSSLKRKKMARRFEDSQHIKISSAPQGHVELTGFAWAEENIQGASGKSIAYLAWQLEQLVSRGKRSKWEIVAKGCKPNGFFINDETGSVWVDMSKADFNCKTRYEKWKTLSEEAKAKYLNVTGGISISGFPPSGSLFGGSFRMGVKELNLGCPVIAHGNLSSLPHSQRTKSVLKGYNSFKERYLKFIQNPGYKMSMLDTDQDGQISEEEHRLGHVYAANSTARKIQIEDPTPSESTETFGVLSQTESDPLIVADTHETYFIKRLRSWSSIGILGGAAMLAGGACFLFLEFSGFFNRP